MYFRSFRVYTYLDREIRCSGESIELGVWRVGFYFVFEIYLLSDIGYFLLFFSFFFVNNLGRFN